MKTKKIFKFKTEKKKKKKKNDIFLFTIESSYSQLNLGSKNKVKAQHLRVEGAPQSTPLGDCLLTGPSLHTPQGDRGIR